MGEPWRCHAMRLQAFEDVREGRLPDFPTIEVYFHTTVDPSIQDPGRQHHSAALFVQWVPYALRGRSWEAEEEGYVQHLLGILDRFAPGDTQEQGSGEGEGARGGGD